MAFFKLFDLKKSLFQLPAGVGHHAAANKLATKLIAAVNEDIQKVVTGGLGYSDTHNINEQILEPLKKYTDLIAALPDSAYKEAMTERLRSLTSTLKIRIDEIPKLKADPSLQSALQHIDHQIGVVPELNPIVKLPDPKFMPPRYHQKTAAEWARIPWANPSRQSADEKVGFFSTTDSVDGRKRASVRSHLIAAENHYSDVKASGTALCYAQADFFKTGDLHADHAQSSEGILRRQQELVNAMNDDPKLAAQVMSSALNQGYFVTDPSGQIYGTKKYYMEYHNCVSNLWLMTGSENTGGGKIAADFTEWLASSPRFGDAFFASIGGKNTIQNNFIIPLTKDGDTLSNAAQRFFRTAYHDEIFATGHLNERVKAPMKATMRKIQDEPDHHRQKQRKLDHHGRMALLREIVVPKDDSDASDSDDESVSSAEVEFNPKTVDRYKKAVETHSDELNALRAKVAATARQEYQNQKAASSSSTLPAPKK